MPGYGGRDIIFKDIDNEYESEKLQKIAEQRYYFYKK